MIIKDLSVHTTAYFQIHMPLNHDNNVINFCSFHLLPSIPVRLPVASHQWETHRFLRFCFEGHNLAEFSVSFLQPPLSTVQPKLSLRIILCYSNKRYLAMVFILVFYLLVF